jgi:hypothetical protein
MQGDEESERAGRGERDQTAVEAQKGVRRTLRMEQSRVQRRESNEQRAESRRAGEQESRRVDNREQKTACRA